jgi:hypothetical protein
MVSSSRGNAPNNLYVRKAQIKCRHDAVSSDDSKAELRLNDTGNTEERHACVALLLCTAGNRNLRWEDWSETGTAFEKKGMRGRVMRQEPGYLQTHKEFLPLEIRKPRLHAVPSIQTNLSRLLWHAQPPGDLTASFWQLLACV